MTPSSWAKIGFRLKRRDYIRYEMRRKGPPVLGYSRDTVLTTPIMKKFVKHFQCVELHDAKVFTMDRDIAIQSWERWANKKNCDALELGSMAGDGLFMVNTWNDDRYVTFVQDLVDALEGEIYLDSNGTETAIIKIQDDRLICTEKAPDETLKEKGC